MYNFIICPELLCIATGPFPEALTFPKLPPPKELLFPTGPFPKLPPPKELLFPKLLEGLPP